MYRLKLSSYSRPIYPKHMHNTDYDLQGVFESLWISHLTVKQNNKTQRTESFILLELTN